MTDEIKPGTWYEDKLLDRFYYCYYNNGRGYALLSIFTVGTLYDVDVFHLVKEYYNDLTKVDNLDYDMTKSNRDAIEVLFEYGVRYL